MKKPLAHLLQREINRLNRELRSHQDKKCRHSKATGVQQSNTGNYDPSADSYWLSLYCPTCLKRWRIDSRDPEYHEMFHKVEIVDEHRYVHVEGDNQ